MNRLLAPSRSPSLLGFPRSLTGRASVWLLAAFVVCFGLWLGWAQAPGGSGALSAAPIGAGLLIAAAAAASCGGIAGILALLLKRERALLLALTSVAGLFVLFFSLGQLAGR